MSTLKISRVKSKRWLLIFLLMTINFVSSIAIVMLNKHMYLHREMPPMFLAGFQFLFTFVGLLFLIAASFFKVKSVSILKVVPLSIAFCSFVVFSNLSLKHNTIGTYQILKCLADPFTFLLQVIMYGKKYTVNVKLSLLTVLIGIIINYWSDVVLNVLGTMFGLIAVIACSLYYTWIGTTQETLQLDPSQLLFYQSSISALLLLAISVTIEYPELYSYFDKFDSIEMIYLTVSGLLALLVSTSVFYIINQTSVITYAVFCKLKICAVLVVGYVIFSEAMVIGQMVGVIITLIGTFSYTAAKLSEQGKSRSRLAGYSPTSSNQKN
ncbi:unnamed protein product [Clavelina lepadiformis]|uniref:Sugar phosphate transporter domain-containing protein n=1 Tax=Clavelina lepadiformis TaxID=159417 RepID=A0ABP0GE40_CLALP